jgi:predicted transcriptional regulator
MYSMKSVLLLAIFGLTRSGDENFDPKQSLKALIEEAKQARSEFQNESNQIQSTLKRVIGKPSLIQTRSLADISKDMDDLKKRKASLLEVDAKNLQTREKEYRDALAKLRRDARV